MSKYQFDKEKIRTLSKELMSTGSASGSSQDYKNFFQSFTNFCGQYLPDDPADISPDDEDELITKLQNTAALYYNAKVGHQHNENRAKRMNAALQIYDMIDSEVNIKEAFGSKPSAENETVDMAILREGFGTELKSKDFDKTIDVYINDSLDKVKSFGSENPLFSKLRETNDRLAELKKQYKDYDKLYDDNASVLRDAFGKVSGSLYKGFSDKISKRINDANNGYTNISSLTSLQKTYAGGKLPDASATSRALYDYTLMQLSPRTDDFGKKMYTLMQNESQINQAEIALWANKILSDNIKKENDELIQDLCKNLSALQVGPEESQQIRKEILKLKNFSGTSAEIDHIIDFIGDITEKHPEYAEKFRSSVKQLSDQKEDFDTLADIIKPAVDLSSEINDFGSIIKDMETCTQQLNHVSESLEKERQPKHYENMRITLNNAARAIGQISESGLSSDDKLFSDPDKLISSCSKCSAKIKKFADKLDKINKEKAQDKEALRDKLRAQYKAASQYKILLADLKGKADKLPSSEDKKTILQCLEKLTSQAKNTALGRDSFIVPDDLTELKNAASALKQSGVNETVLDELAVLGTPVEEYPYMRQLTPISLFKNTLDALTEDLKNATGAFSRDSGEFKEMTRCLDDLRKNLDENPKLLGGNHRDVDYNNREFTEKLDALKKSAMKYFDAKLTQDKNTNRQKRFEAAEKLMNLKGIEADINAVKTKAPDVITDEQYDKDVTHLFAIGTENDSDSIITKLKNEADLIHDTKIRLESKSNAPNNVQRYEKNVDMILDGMDKISQILINEETAWNVLRNPKSTDIDRVLAQRDILVSRGIQERLKQHIASDPNHTGSMENRNNFFEKIGLKKIDLEKMKTDVLNKAHTAHITELIRAEGLSKDDAVMKNFYGSKTLKVPEPNKNGPAK